MKQKIKKYTSLFVLFALLLMTLVPMRLQAATPGIPYMSKIRVGLLMSGGIVTTTATLSSSSEISVGFRNPAGTIELFKTTSRVKFGLSGLHYLRIGTFATLMEANAQADILRMKGIDTSIAYVESSTGYTIEVWIGSGSDAALLEKAKSAALLVIPTLQFTQIDANKAFLVEKKDFGVAGTTNIQQYLLNPNKMRLIISSNGLLSVAERENRSYRGIIELSGYNNSLAVINEVDFEQYLYSVVTSEMGDSFSLEALKAQAVAARTYAIDKSFKYTSTGYIRRVEPSLIRGGIADIYDSTLDQAYKGAGTEQKKSTQAVVETTGEILMTAGRTAVPYYSSNMGGKTADYSEVWKTPLTYTKVVSSPDEFVEQSKLFWYRVILESGIIGYVREDNVTDTGKKTKAGFSIYTAISNDVNVRPLPSTRTDLPTASTALTKVNAGDEFTVIEKRREWNAYSWVTGAITGAQLQTVLNNKLVSKYSVPITTLDVSKVGPSGRAIEVKANGMVIPVSYPDAYRSMFGGLWSTLFEVDNSASYTILGADGKTTTYPKNNMPLYAVGVSSPTLSKAIDSAFIAVNKNDTPRYMTIVPTFRFIGNGYGHGLGMSQFGAKGLADKGYNYKQILGYYFQNISIEKGSI